MKGKMNKKNRIIILSIIMLLLLTGLGTVTYINDYYHSTQGNEVYLENSELVEVSEIKEGLFFDGIGTEKALIFYPGAKVEYTAYVPLFYALVEQGIDCFVVKMPENLAILGMNRAEEIMAEYSYDNWYLSGHSLGGAMAAGFAADNGEKLDGLVLLAAYPTANLPETDFSVISIYGSEDRVLNMESFTSGREYMPTNYTELCIEGGNHAWFAYYGEQEGDGTAVISKEEQQAQTVDAIVKMILNIEQ